VKYNCRRTSHFRKLGEEEQVRKRGLPPLLLGLNKRGQAPLPDLFFPDVLPSLVLFLMVFPHFRKLGEEEQVRKRGLPLCYLD